MSSATPSSIRLLRHVLPNAVASVAVLATSMFGWVLLAESALSFLGLGVPPPAPSWGNMIAQGQSTLSANPRYVFLPSAALFITVVSFNLLGEGLRARWASQ